MYIRIRTVLAQDPRTCIDPRSVHGMGNPTDFTKPFRRLGCAWRALHIDKDQAVRKNPLYRKKYWNAYVDKIDHLLGFTAKPDEKTFAMEIARWQCMHGLETVDGTIGPNTW